MTDWVSWHRVYDDPTGLFARRLAIIQADIRQALDRADPGPIAVISLCAGQGRDLLGALADHPRRGDVVARLVELDPRNVAIAQETARARGLSGVRAVVADGGLADAYRGAVPASLVLVCGVFHWLSRADIARTIRSMPQLCAAGATVIWSHGTGCPPLRSTRRWFRDAGFDELGLTPLGGGFAVVVERFSGTPVPLALGRRLFTFREARTWPLRRLRAALGRLARRLGIRRRPPRPVPPSG